MVPQNKIFSKGKFYVYFSYLLGLITQCVLNSEGMNSFEKKLDAESHRIYQERNKYDHFSVFYPFLIV